MAVRFLYRANAVGVSGRFTRPLDQLIASQAASAIAPAGGYSSAKQDPFQLLEIFSHGGASSEANGSDNPTTGDHETSVRATVHTLNIGGVVLMDSCTARLTSVHPAAGGQPSIIPQGSFFENLRIAGREIDLESRVDLHSMLSTLDELCKAYQENRNFKGQLHFRDDFFFKDEFLKEAFFGIENALHEKQHRFFPYRNLGNTDELPASCGTQVTVVPLFKVRNPSEPGFHVSGNTITVDNFGTVVLGELVVGGYERRLTMLHADLGSPTVGNVTAASVIGNGTTTDPP